MDEGEVGANSPVESPSRFRDRADAKQELQGAFNDWSAMLTSRGLATALGTIGANWAVHGSATLIVDNAWAISSVSMALAFLGVDLIGTALISWSLRIDLKEAESSATAWEVRWQKRGTDPWFPYSKRTDVLSGCLRSAKVLLPTAAAALFLVSVFG